MRSAEVVIIGAGVIGASVAYHLAKRGCGRIVVLERHRARGQGSTSRATGGFRAQFGSEINVRLSLLSREKLLSFQEEMGRDPGYHPCGYLFLAGDEAQLEALRGARKIQETAGLEEAREVTRSEIEAIYPWVRADGLVGGVYYPTDGFILLMEILRVYVEKAGWHGFRLYYSM